MAISNIAKIAVAAAGLTLASLAGSAPAAAQGWGWGAPHYETIQYRGDGWRRDHWRGRPRCFTERVVRRTPYGRRVVERRVCR